MTEIQFRMEIENLIASAHESRRPKLRELQQKCDDIREKHKDNHIESTIEISSLMRESLLSLYGLLDNSGDK